MVDLPKHDTNKPQLFHIAVGWPMGLKIILDKFPTSDVENKYCGESPLTLAMRYSVWASSEAMVFSMCSNCTCAEPVQVLLDAGCFLSYIYLSRIFSPHFGSLRAIYTILRHIKKWRRKLKELMSRIPEVRLQPSDPYGSAVLDAKTGEVVAKLESNGVYPFNEFKLRLDDDRLGDRSGGIESRSIYHIIGDPEIAEIAFRLGFRDLDACVDGCTPLMKAAIGYSADTMPYASWLIVHGAAYTIPMPNELDAQFPYTRDRGMILTRTVSHTLSAGLGRCGFNQNGTTYDTCRPFWELLIGDRCICGCSVSTNGCYPITVFLNAFSSLFSNYHPLCDAFIQICEKILNPVVKADQSGVLTEAIIRAFTFNMLWNRQHKSHGLRHTCCQSLSMTAIIVMETFRGYYRTFHEEIREEDEALLRKLDQLIVEFMEQFSLEDCSLSQFIRVHWFPRMEQVMCELKMDDEDEPEFSLSDIFDLGV